MSKKTMIIAIFVIIVLALGVYALREPLGLAKPKFVYDLTGYTKGVPPPQHESPFYMVKADGFTKLSNSPIWVATFFDYFCPHCQRAEAALKELMEDKRFKGKISIASYIFPLNADCNSIQAAALKDKGINSNGWPSASCDLTYLTAASGDKFKALSSDLFDKALHQFQFDETSIARIANAYEIKDYKKNPQNEMILKQMIDAAAEYSNTIDSVAARKGIYSTPTLIINGYFIVGLPNMKEKEALESIFLQVLKEK